MIETIIEYNPDSEKIQVWWFGWEMQIWGRDQENSGLGSWNANWQRDSQSWGLEEVANDNVRGTKNTKLSTKPVHFVFHFLFLQMSVQFGSGCMFLFFLGF